MMLSSIVTVSVFTVVVDPLTVRFPLTIKLLLTVTSPVNTGEAKVAIVEVFTATVGVVPSPELLERVIPVPATSDCT